MRNVTAGRHTGILFTIKGTKMWDVIIIWDDRSMGTYIQQDVCDSWYSQDEAMNHFVRCFNEDNLVPLCVQPEPEDDSSLWRFGFMDRVAKSLWRWVPKGRKTKETCTWS